MKIRLSIMAAAACFVPHSTLLAEEDGDALKLAKDLGARYAAAFAQGDASALGALYAEDAEYTGIDGETLSGRQAIQDRSEAFFQSTKERALEATNRTARYLTDGVLVEKGFTTTFVDDEDPAETRYSLTYVKKGEQWLISEIQESALPDPDPGAEAMASLEWLVGEWKTTDEEIGATASVNWTLNGEYLTRTTTLPGDDGTTFLSVEIIGYDPDKDQLRSWIFDNEGGFGGGLWRQDGNKWLLQSQATLPDGSRSSSQHVITVVTEDRLQLETVNRVLDGELLPGRDPVTIVRDSTKASKASTNQ
jgi:uncharacterized protein (TIGR02246 family)